MPLARGYELEVLDRGGVAAGSSAAGAILDFWAGHDAAGARLEDVVCVVRDHDGAVVATSTAVDAPVAELGGRRFWVYRCLAPSAVARAAAEPMLLAARAHLSERLGADGRLPAGICFPVSDRELIAAHGEAVWEASEMAFAGWSAAGEQLRVCLFEPEDVVPLRRAS